MRLSKLAVQNFRNFTMQDWDFAQTTLIYGPNGIGKTSLIEAINLLAIGESFRASKVEEMVRLEAELGRVQGLFILDRREKGVAAEEEKELGVGGELDADDEKLKLEVMLTRGLVAGKKSQYRLFSVNDVRRRRADFLQNLSVVVFRPEDLRLVEGSPARRRHFLDDALAMFSWEYRHALQQYEQTLKRRNRLLPKVRDGEEKKDVLSFWNLNLVKHGQFLQQERSRLIDFIREVIFPFELNIEYLPSLISEERLKQHLDREIIVGHSLIGPHKDDFLLKFTLADKGIEDLSLLAYGSRGQQRLGVLWLKIAELQFLHSRVGYQPILLLDDIMSELDENSKGMVLDLLDQYQTVLTTADEGVVEELKEKIKELSLIKLN